ncbi:iron permease, partial [Epithele typhae]|uniref:iron permease n=1 Tax=Epithele typhae TaxID=378194 RepID=UPI0020074082
PPGSSKGSAFWLTIVAVLVCTFLAALDFSVISTALPTIISDLDGSDNFVWVSAAYNLASATILPLCGQLADVFGRRPVMFVAVTLFFIGSALCGAARDMSWLIGARTLQGIGAGGIVGLSSIIISDLVFLAERGVYQALLSLTWALAAAIGPLIGAALTEHTSWRWIFYVNLPLAGVAMALVIVFLKVRTPPGAMMDKLRKIDFVGNAIIVIGTTLVLLALTWGGIRYSWSDAHVVAPLVLGILIIGLFFPFEYLLQEKRIPFLEHTEPTLPVDILTNRTSVGGYIATFFHGIISISVIYYLPIFFQACQSASPVRSSTMFFAFTFVCPFLAVVSGAVIKSMSKYRIMNYIGWALILIGLGLYTTFKEDASPGQWIGFTIIVAAGLGIIWVSVVFPILAPIPVARSARALAFFQFCRAFAQTWGVTISANIVQNELKARLPAAFLAEFPGGVEIAVAAVPLVKTLPEPLRAAVRAAFAASMARVWVAMVGFAALGALSVLLLREVPLSTGMDDTYGLATDAGRSLSSESEG